MKMNIAVSINQAFIRYLHVMLVSLFENNREQELCVWLMSADLTEAQVQTFHELAQSYGQELRFLRIGEGLFSKELPFTEQITIETYFRLALPDLLPEELDRVLYLDADIIINQPLDEFYFTDFNGKSLCACRDVAAVSVTHVSTSPLFAELRQTPGFTYFNAGVLLMNLKKLREKVSLEYFVQQALRLKDYLTYHDQDLLNYLFHDDVVYADEKRFNLIIRPACNSGYTYDEVKSMAVILHYAGPKPWRHEEVRYGLERFWWEYAKKTPYYVGLLEDIVLGEIDTGYMDQMYRDLKRENDELRAIVDKCMTLLKKLS